MARKRVKREDCPNCGSQLRTDDNYCGSCGQENHTHKLPVGHFLVELLSGLFNFDTKLLHTLRDLFWPPGLVIREYNANKRARYVPPLRLYLFTSVLFFILLAWTTERLDIGTKDVVAVNHAGEGSSGNQGLTLNFGENEDLSDSALTALSKRSVLTNAAIDSALIASKIDPGFWARIAVRLGVNASASSDRKAAYVQNIFSMFSKIMFVLLPLFALILHLLNIRSGRFYTEHLVFALYFHTVVYMLVGVRLLLGQVFGSIDAMGLMNLFALVYLIWAMRVVYARSWWLTILQTALLVFFYFILVLLGFGVAAIGGVF